MKRIEILENTLKFYADDNNYNYLHSKISTTITEPIILVDNGSRAKKALLNIEE